jgi:hypothetical protein
MKTLPAAQKRPFILALATAVALTVGSPLGHAVPLQPGAAARAYWFTDTPATGYVYAPFNSAMTLGLTSYSHTNAAHTLSTNAFMGEVKLFNEVIRTTNGTSQSSAEGGFQDMITIDDPTRTGHQGVFHGSVHVHMDQAVTGSVSNNLFGVAVGSDIGYARLAHH